MKAGHVENSLLSNQLAARSLPIQLNHSDRCLNQRRRGTKTTMGAHLFIFHAVMGRHCSNRVIAAAAELVRDRDVLARTKKIRSRVSLRRIGFIIWGVLSLIYKTMSINNRANMCQEIQPFAEVESPLDAKILRSDKKSWSVAPTSRPQGSGTVFKKSKGKRSLSFISGKHVVNVVTVLH